MMLNMILENRGGAKIAYVAIRSLHRFMQRSIRYISDFCSSSNDSDGDVCDSQSVCNNCGGDASAYSPSLPPFRVCTIFSLQYFLIATIFPILRLRQFQNSTFLFTFGLQSVQIFAAG